jgi:hypothetical protein
MISQGTKQIVNKIIFERAYEIEQMLSEDDFFLARMGGLRPDQVEDASLRIAVKELEKEFN